MIQLENVHKSYGQTKVLKGIDLQIQDQDDVVILGPSAVSYTHLRAHET